MSGQLLKLREARRTVLERAVPLSDESVALRDALGRVLAEDVVSSEAVPGFDNSAMDGFAVRAADTKPAGNVGAVSLRVVDESRAGHPAGREVGTGEAIRISTSR